MDQDHEHDDGELFHDDHHHHHHNDDDDHQNDDHYFTTILMIFLARYESENGHFSSYLPGGSGRASVPNAGEAWRTGISTKIMFF